MRLKEYTGKMRRALNNLAENNLPGGGMWSDDMRESYRVYKETFPYKVFYYPTLAVSVTSERNLIYTCIEPNILNAAVTAFVTSAAVYGWHRLHLLKELASYV